MTAIEKTVRRQSNLDYRLMVWLFKITDLFVKSENKVTDLGIQTGQTVVDFGCGPGRYLPKISELVGPQGKVYAADIHEIALQEVEKKIQQQPLSNVEKVRVAGYPTNIPDHVADFVLALDMFHMIAEPTELLTELHRILKPGGTLILEDGHQPRTKTKASVLEAGMFKIVADTKDHLKCRPLK